MLDLIIFFVALSVLVIIHEFGHFFAAKKVGIKVEEFGLGIPPRAWGKKIGETIWSLNWLPIGGFVRMYGEDPHVTNKDAHKMGHRAFVNKTPLQKFVVVVGGVTMNMILAIAIFAVVYKNTGIPVETDKVRITDISPESPAAMAGMRENEVILKIMDTPITKPQELIEIVGKNKGKEIKIVTDLSTYSIVARENPPAGQGSLGVAISNSTMQPVAWWEIHKSVGQGFKEAYFWGKVIVEGLGKMVADVFSGRGAADVSGPIGMYQATSSIRQSQGMLAVLHFFGIISVNLAVMNILPLPALDGGRLMFVIYEAITKKRPNPDWEGRIHQAGMLFLLGLIALVAIGDVVKLFR